MIVPPAGRDERIRELFEQNLSDEEIGQIVRLSVSGVAKARHKMRLIRRQPLDLTPDVIDAIHARVEEGWPITEIYEEFGVGYKSLLRRCDPDAVKENADAWRAIIRWARNNHADLFAEIRPATREEMIWRSR